MMTPKLAADRVSGYVREIPSAGHDLQEVVIQPSRGWAPLDLKELWDYRDLLLVLAWRDLKVRYQQTALGASWAIIQPVLTMLILTAVFGHLVGVKVVGTSYPVFVYCGLVPWLFFANAITHASNSLVEHEEMITKIYFPRLILPMASVLAGLVDFAIAFVLLVLLMTFSGAVPTIAIWTLPLLIVLATMAALSVSVWLSALNVQYRDIRYAVPFLTQILFFLTPIAYPGGLVSSKYRVLFDLNPLAGIVEGFRWALLPSQEFPGAFLATSVIVVVILLVTGMYYFRRAENTFAEVV
jgi:lipopolysaccharide transport system permease protein